METGQDPDCFFFVLEKYRDLLEEMGHKVLEIYDTAAEVGADSRETNRADKIFQGCKQLKIKGAAFMARNL